MRKPNFKIPEDWMRPGTKVYYHSIIKDPHDGVIREIESPSWKLKHGQWVIKVSGISGGVAIEAITRVENPTIPNSREN